MPSAAEPIAPLPTPARPVPARGVARLDRAVFGADVPAGTRVSGDGAAVEFRTAAATRLSPVTLAGVERLADRLRLTLHLHGPDLRSPGRVDSEDGGEALRVFVGRADVYRALTAAPVRAEVVGRGVVSADAVRPAGFDVGDAVLPADPREPEALRLLAEWAVFPDKFLFVDVVGLGGLVGPLARLDLVPDAATWATLGEGVPPLLLGCVPVLNRRVVDLPPVPLRRAGEAVRLDVDPLGENPPRVVMEVLAARAVRAGRTVATYAERLAPLPPPLAVRRVGVWSFQRRGDQAWLALADRGPATGGRTLLVTAACCRRALPAGTPPLAAGAAWVGPVRPPLWPAPTADFHPDRPGEWLADVAAAFGRPEVAGFVRRCDTAAVAVRWPNGTAHGTEFRLALDPAGLSADDAFLLCRVLDHAVASAGPVNRFTRVTATTAAGALAYAGPPRAGQAALPGAVVPGTASPATAVAAVERRANGRQSRSDQQAAAVARTFAAVTRPTSVTSLAGVLRHLLDVPVRVRPFQPARAPVDPAAQLRLGGVGRVLGRQRQCWGVRVELGPLDRRTFDRFGPGSRALRRVRLLIEAAVGPACPVTIEPVLRADLADPWHLGGGRLGRSLRLGGPRSTRDARSSDEGPPV